MENSLSRKNVSVSIQEKHFFGGWGAGLQKKRLKHNKAE